MSKERDSRRVPGGQVKANFKLDLGFLRKDSILLSFKDGSEIFFAISKFYEVFNFFFSSFQMILVYFNICPASTINCV